MVSKKKKKTNEFKNFPQAHSIIIIIPVICFIFLEGTVSIIDDLFIYMVV
jgi:hypothetical protein